MLNSFAEDRARGLDLVVNCTQGISHEEYVVLLALAMDVAEYVVCFSLRSDLIVRTRHTLGQLQSVENRLAKRGLIIFSVSLISDMSIARVIDIAGLAAS